MSTEDRLSTLRTKPLTLRQERRLVAYLDDQFLQLTRGYKKRTLPSTTVPTLHAYLVYARRLLALILQIPPLDPSTSLRTQYLLRLTGDVLNAIPGYTLPSQSDSRFVTQREVNGPSGGTAELNEDEPKDYRSVLRELLDWLDDLDQAWLAVLQLQVWDPEMGEGVDLILNVGYDEKQESNEGEGVTPEETRHSNDSNDEEQMSTPKSTPVSQTDVTRLKSLLVTSISDLEEWLGRSGRSPDTSVVGGEDDDVTEMLDRLGLLDEFDELFGRTTDFLGGFGGYVVEPEAEIDDIEYELNDARDCTNNNVWAE